MSEFFRFRSIDSLLGRHQELEEQTIYFAGPEELNDPMEGLRDIVWNGDKIVWTNFFKHYVFCLNRSYLLLNIIGKPSKLDVADIPILERWDQMTTPIERILFDDILDRFYNLPYIQEIIEALANTKRKIRYREIVSHLQGIQTFGFLDEIRASYIDHRLLSESQTFQSPEGLHNAMGMEMLLNAIKQAENVEDEHTLDALDAVYQVIEAKSDNTRVAILMPDFPKIYVEQLDRLLWSKWYTACFTGCYHNSSVWAKYADGHKGVCLIFEAVENNHSNSLKLNHKTNNSSITLPFHKVNYERRLGEIDFFRTICRMTKATLRELWYTDQNGNTSAFAAHIESNSDGATWKELYWNNFFRDVTFKTKDWAYEQEYRLILENGLSQYNEKDKRVLTYDFNALKGIIFGIRTPTEDKRRIIEIIKEKKKCDGNNQADFTFFQSYYSVKDGDIRAIPKHRLLREK